MVYEVREHNVHYTTSFKRLQFTSSFQTYKTLQRGEHFFTNFITMQKIYVVDIKTHTQFLMDCVYQLHICNFNIILKIHVRWTRFTNIFKNDTQIVHFYFFKKSFSK